MDKDKTERIVLAEYDSLNAMIQYLSRKYSMFTANTIIDLNNIAQERLSRCIVEKLKECVESNVASP